MTDIFHADNFISNVVVQHNPRGRNDDRFYGTSHEYMIVFARDKKSANLGFFTLTDEEKKAYGKRDEISQYHEVSFMRTGNNSDRHTRPNLFYPIYVNPKDDTISLTHSKDAIELLPINSSGEEKTWRWEKSTFEERQATEISVKKTGSEYRLFKRRRLDGAGKKPKTVWIESKYDASSHGIMHLRSILGKNDEFSYPKSIDTVSDALLISADSDAQILDYFAGSGTTGEATITLNRNDSGERKFILVEMGKYFDTVVLPRIKKVTFSPEWEDGKPKRLATTEEAERSPRIVKVIRLESYEDTLNNLDVRRTEKQQLLLDDKTAKGADGLSEQYLLRYMLNVETRGSQSLLNIQDFSDPTAYKLTVKRPGSDESTEVNIDLIETFNWLTGITVKHIAAPQTFSAKFERDAEKRLKVKDRIKQDAEGPFWFRTVTGTTPDGRKVLVIWRKLTGKPEEDNLVLDEWFAKQGYSAKDSEFDNIWVNGGNNLENLKAPDDRWKVRLIEEDFHRLMFEMEGIK
jgi:adenine-specific DNA-methyltransferase